MGGCPSVRALSSGVSSQSLDEENTEERSEEDENIMEQINDATTDVPTEPANNVKDNRRKHLQKKISVHQREMLLIDIAKKEVEIKCETVDIMKHSIEQTERTMKAMTESFLSVGNGIKEGLTLLAQSFSAPAYPPQPQWAGYTTPHYLPKT